MITVSLDTNCRIGPGKAYDRVGALLVGEYAQVIARDPTGEYWYISNPDGSGYCWLWGEYAILSGNYVALPIFTPPPTPTPTPNFEASYKSLDNCSGWWVDIRLKNTGGTPFVSMSMSVRDTVTDSLVSYSRDGFTNIDSCSDSTTTGTLRPGDVLTVSSPLFAYDPTGHKLRATIELCTNTDQTGTCVKQTITFTPE
jgi:hypothetical protein